MAGNDIIDGANRLIEEEAKIRQSLGLKNAHYTTEMLRLFERFDARIRKLEAKLK